MKKRIEHNLKAEKRELKKRPRMRVTGASLKKTSKFAGLSIIKKSKRK
ncbi:MAG: hypothetical protein Q8P83_00535 [bacterium]|nr:hypothetical protein [bacterium]